MCVRVLKSVLAQSIKILEDQQGLVGVVARGFALCGLWFEPPHGTYIC